MKINRILIVSAFSAFFAINLSAVKDIAPEIYAYNDYTPALIAANKYKDTLYDAGLAQANTAMAANDINGFITGITQMAQAYPADVVVLMQTGKMLGYDRMTKVFGQAELPNIAKAVFSQLPDLEGDAQSFINAYSTTGLSSDNMLEGLSLITSGIDGVDTNSGDPLTTPQRFTNVQDGLTLLNSNTENEPYLQDLQKDMMTPGSTLYNRLISAFEPDQLATIFQAAGFNDDAIAQIYGASETFVKNVGSLQEAFDNLDVNVMSQTLSSMAQANPTLVSELLQNGYTLSESNLSAAGFTTEDLVNIARSAGLSEYQVAEYAGGTYSATSPVAPVPVDPILPPTPGTGGSTGAGSNVQPPADGDSYATLQSKASSAMTQITELTSENFVILGDVLKAQLAAAQNMQQINEVDASIAQYNQEATTRNAAGEKTESGEPFEEIG